MLDPRPGYPLTLLATLLTLVAVIVGAILILDSLPMRLLLSVVLAFLTGQIFFLGHDVAHNQAFTSSRWNRLFSIAIWNGLVGFSSSWWQARHNAHHRDPNRLDVDPDLKLLLVYCDARQAGGAPAWRRRVARFQAWFLLLRTLEVPAGSIVAIRSMLNCRGAERVWEFAFFVLHWALYITFLIALGGIGQALIMLALHRILAGLYITSVNALNHKTMPFVGGRSPLDFLAQQLHTTQNIRSSRFVDIWCGGLNRQIEHHLFLGMPRPNLPRARDSVRAFCRTHDLPYQETSLARAYMKLVVDFAHVGKLVSNTAVPAPAR